MTMFPHIIAFLALAATSCLAGAHERQQIFEEQSKTPEMTEFLGPSNLLHTKLDILELAAPLESLIAPAFQVGILDALENFIRVLLETLTGLDEISNSDSDFFKDLDGRSSLIHMLESIHRTASAEQPGSTWNTTITKLLDDMQYEIERLPEKTREDASHIMQQLRDVSSERGQLQERSGSFLERIASDLATQLLRVGNTFGSRAFSHISRLGGAGIFQAIHDDINTIIGDPRMQAVPREVLDRISEFGSIVANERDNFITNRSFPSSLLESWNRILSLPVEVLQVLDRCRSEILRNLFSVAAERLHILGIPLPLRVSGLSDDSGKNEGRLRSSRNFQNQLPGSDLPSIMGESLSLVSRSAGLLQDSAEIIAGTLLAPVNKLIYPLLQLRRGPGHVNARQGGHESSEDNTDSLTELESPGLTA